MWKHFFSNVDQSNQISVDLPLNLLMCCGLCRTENIISGIIHQHVNTLKGIYAFSYSGFNAIQICDVALYYLDIRPVLEP